MDIITDAEFRIYQLSIEQHKDPIRAVLAYRRVEAITDDDERARVRRLLTGSVLPIDDAADAELFAVTQMAADYMADPSRKPRFRLFTINGGKRWWPRKRRQKPGEDEIVLASVEA